MQDHSDRHSSRRENSRGALTCHYDQSRFLTPQWEVMVPEDDSYRTWELEDRYSIEPEWADANIAAGSRSGWIQQASLAYLS